MGARRYYPAARAILQVVFEDFGSEDDSENADPLVIPVLPKACTIHKNSYKQADSYELTFDAGDLPFDPRIIRAGAAEIYLFQADQLGGTNRVLSRRDPLSDVDPAHRIPRNLTDTLAIEVAAKDAKQRFTAHNKPRIAGLFDRTGLELSSDGKWVTISGQDYTAHLASLQWKPEPSGVARRIPVGKRVDLLLEDVLAEADPTGVLAIDVRGIDKETLPIVGAGDVRGSARGIPVEQKTSYWDVIYSVATRVGLIAYVDGVDIVLSRPKTITATDQTKIKRLAWGKNLEHLKLDRELGKEQSPTIVIRSYDPKTRQTISVEYPAGQVNHARQPMPRATRVHGAAARVVSTERIKAKKTAHKHGKAVTTLRRRDEYQIIPVYGITDRKVLEQMAENRYHLIGPAERKVVATTRDLRDMADSDMLDIEAGDAVTIEWDEFNAELLASPDKTEEQKVAHLVARGFNREIARKIATCYAQLQGLDRPLRVREATYQYDADEGVSIEIELYDFIMVDGIRPGDGAPAPTRANSRDPRTFNGDLIGLSAEQRDALSKRYP